MANERRTKIRPTNSIGIFLPEGDWKNLKSQLLKLAQSASRSEGDFVALSKQVQTLASFAESIQEYFAALPEGYTGSFTDQDGNVVSVESGIIVSVSS